MTLVVRDAPEGAKPIVHRLLELNAYEFSAVDGRDIGPDGEYGYRYLDCYWGGADDRAAFLFHVDGQLAGFALVRLGKPHQVAEFLVLPKYRRRGLGTAAARQVLSRFHGEWVTHEVPGNDRAAEFWRRADTGPIHRDLGRRGHDTAFRDPGWSLKALPCPCDALALSERVSVRRGARGPALSPQTAQGCVSHGSRRQATMRNRGTCAAGSPNSCSSKRARSVALR